MFQFGKSSSIKEVEGGTLDRWKKFLQRANDSQPVDEESFLRADEIEGWGGMDLPVGPGLNPAQTQKVIPEVRTVPNHQLAGHQLSGHQLAGHQLAGHPPPHGLAVERPVSENLIARFGSEIRSALGPGTLIEGKFAFDSPVRIDGTLRGEVHSSSLLVVGEEGIIEGLVCVGNLIVFGRVRGHVVAEEVVQVTSSGELRAEIESGQLAIDLGGVFEGSVKRTTRPQS